MSTIELDWPNIYSRRFPRCRKCRSRRTRILYGGVENNLAKFTVVCDKCGNVQSHGLIAFDAAWIPA